MENFRTYKLAVEFYRLVRLVQISGHLRDQLLRAASSIALNLAEGYGRITKKDQARHYRIALGSLRECQAILHLTYSHKVLRVVESADSLGAHLYRLIQKTV